MLSLPQAYGIEEVEVNGNKERRYTRHVHFIGPGAEEIDARLVFDYREWFSDVNQITRTHHASEGPL